MNKERLLAVAAAIENETVADAAMFFDMTQWGYERKTGNSCGTVGCVAGFAAAMSDWSSYHARIDAGEAFGVPAAARRFLELTCSQANRLFMPEECGWVNDNKHLVPDALRWMAATGTISWIQGLEAAKCVAGQGEKE